MDILILYGFRLRFIINMGLLRKLNKERVIIYNLKTLGVYWINI